MTDYHRKNPYLAKVKARLLLTPAPSTRRTYHIELDIQDSGLEFQVGDSIGIYPHNPACLVERILSLLQVQPQDTFFDPRANEELSYKEFLTTRANLCKCSSAHLKIIAANHTSAQKKDLLEKLQLTVNAALRKAYLEEHEIWDLLEEHQEANINAQEFCAKLLPMMPRFYSIASSPKIYPHEIHLTVACIAYETNVCRRVGIASHYLTKVAEIDDTFVPIYVQPAPHFKLPKDPNSPIIMIGPGTGIAPYRGFLQERALTNSKNWLFFGERNEATDYYYESYFKQLEKEKKLRLTTAFSRDQKDKLYVQHKLIEAASDLWKWIQDGAYIYVCGDAKQMAKDVDLALCYIIESEGKLSPEEAKNYLKDLHQNRRYLRDVY